MSKDRHDMAWEEPGRNQNQNKDPWDRKPKKEGPPDLDELFKNFLGKLKMGGGGGSGHSAIGGTPQKYLPYLFGGVFLLLYFVSGFYRVNPPEQAVVTRFGHYQRIENSLRQ